MGERFSVAEYVMDDELACFLPGPVVSRFLGTRRHLFCPPSTSCPPQTVSISAGPVKGLRRAQALMLQLLPPQSRRHVEMHLLHTFKTFSLVQMRKEMDP